MGMLSCGQRSKCADLLNSSPFFYIVTMTLIKSAGFSFIKYGGWNGDKTHHGPDKRDPVQYASE